MSDPASLALDAEDVRRLGYRIVDLLTEQYAAPRSGPPVPEQSMRAFLERISEPAPAGPGDPDAALELALEALRDQMNHIDHPRFFSRIPGPSSAAGALGDMLATAMNAAAMSQTGHAGPTALELLVLRWLAELMGMPAESEGVLVGGGSLASLTAFAAARQAVLGGHDPAATVYLTDQSHSSMGRGLRVLGFAADRVRVLETDERLRMMPGVLAQAVAADRAVGLRPFLVLATAGTTNSGAVDPMEAIAELAATEGLWFHVDGAYGAPAVLTERGRRLLGGMERADSLSLDAHKWLFAPYEAGALLMRRPGLLEAAFTETPEYLRDSGAGIHLRNRSPQLSRAARAVKLWMIFKVHGVDALSAAIDRGQTLAEVAEHELRRSGQWEVVSPAQLGIVCFTHRRVAAERLSAVTVADGYAAPSSTALHGTSVVRLCTINPRTTEDEIRATVRRMEELADTC